MRHRDERRDAKLFLGPVQKVLGTGQSRRREIGEMRGQLLPYAIYVPSGTPPAGGWGLTLLLHSLSANYNQFEGSRNQSQFANRALPSIVITPSGRGPDGGFRETEV